MAEAAENTPYPFPGSEKFSPDQVKKLFGAIQNISELAPTVIKHLVAETGVGSFRGDGFPDDKGFDMVETLVRSRAKVMLISETVELLGEQVNFEEIRALVANPEISLSQIPSR